MNLLKDLFELVRDTSFQDVAEESTREVAIALAGNSLEARDRLHRAFSNRLGSLWTPGPFRLVEQDELPTVTPEEGGGLVVFAIEEGDRIGNFRKEWLTNIAGSPESRVIIVVVPNQHDGQEKKRNRLQAINPLRLIGGRDTSHAGADGAASIAPGELFLTPQRNWDDELADFIAGSDRFSLVKLVGLELQELQRELLPLIVKHLAGKELALCRRAPIFRNTVASHFINKAARDNSELVLLSNVTAGIPFLADIFGGGADFVLLSKNQFELSHRLAVIYGQERNGRVEMWLELAPIVGGALLWRTIARTATRKLPFFLALLPKAAISYGATALVGRAAQYYYATGRTAPAQISSLVRGMFERLRERSGKGDTDQGGNSERRLRSV